jgi:hypothetical protein
MKNGMKYGLLVTLMLMVTMASGQRAEAVIGSDSVLIGDHVPLTLTFKSPENGQVQWPYQQDTITGKIEIISQSSVDSVSLSGDSVALQQELVVTSFDTGFLAIPPFEFNYSDNNQQQLVKTDPLLLYVQPMDVDTAQPIKAIKGPMGAPLTFLDILPWLLIALAVILLGTLIWYVIWRKRQQKPILPVREKPRDPAHIEALNALENLQEQKLWQNGKVKEYFTEISHIIRVYLERRYTIPAVESTSGEIIEELRKKSFDKQAFKQLHELFEISDLAKFAKYEPLPSENDKALNDAFEVVNRTKPVATEVEENRKKGGGDVE